MSLNRSILIKKILIAIDQLNFELVCRVA